METAPSARFAAVYGTFPGKGTRPQLPGRGEELVGQGAVGDLAGRARHADGAARGPVEAEASAAQLEGQRAAGQAADLGGDRDRAGAGAAGQGLADAPLPGPLADRGPVDHLGELDVGLGREEGRVGLQPRPDGGHRRLVDIVHEHHRVRVAHGQAGGGPRLAVDLDGALALQGGRSHVDGDPVDAAAVVGVQLQALDSGPGLQVEGAGDISAVAQVLADHPDAVAAHLGQGAVGVAVVHEERGLGAGGDADHAVGADPEVAVADRPGQLGSDVIAVGQVLHDHEVVARPVRLDELHACLNPSRASPGPRSPAPAREEGYSIAPSGPDGTMPADGGRRPGSASPPPPAPWPAASPAPWRRAAPCSQGPAWPSVTGAARPAATPRPPARPAPWPPPARPPWPAAARAPGRARPRSGGSGTPARPWPPGTTRTAGRSAPSPPGRGPSGAGCRAGSAPPRQGRPPPVAHRARSGRPRPPRPPAGPERPGRSGGTRTRRPRRGSRARTHRPAAAPAPARARPRWPRGPAAGTAPPRTPPPGRPGRPGDAAPAPAPPGWASPCRCPCPGTRASRRRSPPPPPAAPRPPAPAPSSPPPSVPPPPARAPAARRGGRWVGSARSRRGQD